MAKQSKNAVKVSSTDKTKASVSLPDHLVKQASVLAKLPKIILALIVGAILVAIANASGETATGTAMLYMLAENGKKSGRADGNVYMRNGRIRAMAIPRLVQNAFTGAARNAFGTLSSAFRSLTQSQQNSWINATGFTTSDRFGRTVTITGKALYNWLNGNLAACGEDTLTTCPDPRAVDSVEITAFSVDISDTEMEITLSTGAVPATSAIKVFATAPQSNGINRPSASKYRLVSVLAPGAAAPHDIWTEYAARFGAPVAGQKVFIKTEAVLIATGQAGVPSLAMATAVA